MKTISLFLSLLFILTTFSTLAQNKFVSPKYGGEITFPSDYKYKKMAGIEIVICESNGYEYNFGSYKSNFNTLTKQAANLFKNSSNRIFTDNGYQIAVYSGIMKTIKGSFSAYLYYIQQIGAKEVYGISIQSSNGNLPDKEAANQFFSSFVSKNGYTIPAKYLIGSEALAFDQGKMADAIKTSDDPKHDFSIGGGVSYTAGDFAELKLGIGWNIEGSYGYYLFPSFKTGFKVGYTSWSDDGTSEGYGVGDMEQSGNVTYYHLDETITFGEIFKTHIGVGAGYYSSKFETLYDGELFIKSEGEGMGFAPKIGFSVSTGGSAYIMGDVQYHFGPEDLQFMTIGLSLHFGG